MQSESNGTNNWGEKEKENRKEKKEKVHIYKIRICS